MFHPPCPTPTATRSADPEYRSSMQASSAPFFGKLRQPGPNFMRRAAVIGRVDEVEQCQQKPHTDRPHWPAMLGHPPERYAFQITQEQRWIAHGRQAAPHVRHDKDE